MKLFAVLDVKANYFLKPFAESSAVQALRGFEVAANEDSTFKRFPDDFALCELGDFDSQTGVLTPRSSPVNLATARHLLKKDDLPQTKTPIELRASGSPNL